MSGAYVIVANVAKADSSLRLGARVVVYTIPGNPESVYVRGLSRGGRRITKWTKASRLRNFRPAWERATEAWTTFETREAAQKCIAARFGAR